MDIVRAVAKIKPGVDVNSGRRCFVEERVGRFASMYKCTVMIPLEEYQAQTPEVQKAGEELVRQGKHFQYYNLDELELEGRAIQGLY